MKKFRSGIAANRYITIWTINEYSNLPDQNPMIPRNEYSNLHKKYKHDDKISIKILAENYYTLIYKGYALVYPERYINL